VGLAEAPDSRESAGSVPVAAGAPADK